MIAGLRQTAQFDPLLSATTELDAGTGFRAVQRCRQLSKMPYSDRPDQLFRPFLGAAHAATIDRVGQFMTEAGMSVRVDPAANLIGRFEGNAPGAPALIIGSHLDTVADAGCFDGLLGVLVGIEYIARLNASARRLPFAIEIIGFGDEEGSRFPTAMMCSNAVTGTLNINVADVHDYDGKSLVTALEEFGVVPDRFADAARSPSSIIGYLEVHIEQGPVLEAEDLALGVVTGFAAQRRWEVTLKGKSNHAGTTPMLLRRDALAAAAEIILLIELEGLANPEQMATVGRLDVDPGSSNVVPGKVRMSVDIRARSDAQADAMASNIRQQIELIAVRRSITFDLVETLSLCATQCDPALTERLSRSVATVTGKCRSLNSGAGHDAMVMAAITPIALLFVRCRDGISHNPAEHIDDGDAELAINTIGSFVDSYADYHAAAIV